MPTDFLGRVMVVFNRYGMSMLQGAPFLRQRESFALWKFHKNQRLFFHFLREWG